MDELHDPSKEGIGGIKGLNKTGVYQPAQELSTNYRATSQKIATTGPTTQNIGYAGVGDSHYDKDIHFAEQLDNLNETRANLQPWYSQLGAGLVNMGVTTGTTFADGIVGTLAGIGNAVFGDYNPNSTRSRGEQALDRFVNNPVSVALNNVNN